MSVMLRRLAKTLASSVKRPEVTTKQPAATLGFVSAMTFEQRWTAAQQQDRQSA